MKSIVTTIITALIVLVSCTPSTGVYERMAFFSNHEWHSREKKSFSFDVTDTLAEYRLYVVLRHADAYNWRNIWLNIEFKGPDSTYQVKREFFLSDNKKWYGTVIDDIVDQRIPFTRNNVPTPLRKGKYTITLQQVMREDPLQHVLNAGIRVEKVE